MVAFPGTPHRMPTLSPKQQKWFNLFICALLFVLPMMRVGRFNTPVFWDDISVVFVYALNLLDTGSFWYNTPGDRLDGFTSTMDVLFAVPLALLDPENLFRLNYYAKAFLTSLVPVALFAALVRHGVHFAVAATVALALAMSEVLASGFAMQLEAPVYALLIIAFLISLTRNGRRHDLLTFVCGALLIITRPEALVLVGTGVATRLYMDAGRVPLRPALVAAGALTAFVLAWFGWRIAYFGYWAPNTYYAKLGGTRLQEIQQGLEFMAGYLLRAPDTALYVALLILTGALLPVWLRRSGEPLARGFAIAATVAFAMLAVRVATGGDSYTISSRLVIDFAVPAALATGLGLGACRPRWVLNTALLFVVIAVAGNGLNIARGFPGNVLGFVALERLVKQQLVCERDAIREAHRRWPAARLAHTDFQRAKYFVPDMEVIDLSGLNHREIAHSTKQANLYGKHDLDYALDQQAEIIKLGTGVMEAEIITEAQWLQSLSPDGEVVRDLRNTRKFLLRRADELARDYKPLAIDTPCGYYLNLLVRQDIGATRTP